MEPHSTTLPKPPIPYVKGWRFTVQQHISPGPTKVTQGCYKYTKATLAERRQLTLVERCLRHPPLPGLTEPCRVELEVLDPIQVKDGTNAQVFTVQILKSQSNAEYLQPGEKKLVAKVYDPLYFDDDDGSLDPFICVDHHYTHEVAAYDILSKWQGTLIPRFYGSYTMDIPAGGSETRVVRLILVEYIPGLTMREANPRELSQHTRQMIMKSIVNFESQVYGKRDVVLLSPRNIILAESDGSDSSNSTPKLVFVDFANALFNRRKDDPRWANVEMFNGQYVSPLLRWRKQWATLEFYDWIDWEWEPWKEAEFADTAWTITPEMRKRFGKRNH